MFLSTLNAWGGVLLVIFQIVAILYGAIKLMNKITSRLDKLEEQYRPNGGSSMRDAVNRIELKLSKLDGKFEQHIEEHKK
jgi:predicted Holliday junction resolvase-like endonuclease